MTILSALIMFLIFTACNIIQLVLIKTVTFNQEQDTLQKKAQLMTTYIAGSYKKNSTQQKALTDTEQYFKSIIESNETIKLVNQNGKVILSLSKDLHNEMEFNSFKKGFYKVRKHDDEILILNKPIHIENLNGILQLGVNIELFSHYEEQVSLVLLFGTIISFILSGFSGIYLSKKMLSPLKHMNQTMIKIKNNELQERVKSVHTKDEFSELGEMFNNMMDELEQSIRKQQRFVEDASHELRTPLSIIHGHLSLIKRWGKDNKEVLENSIEACLNETNRMIVLTKELLQLSKLEKTDEEAAMIKQTNIHEVIKEVITNYRLLYSDVAITLNFQEQKEPKVLIAKEHLIQIIIIILDNAIKYSGENKKIDLSIATKNSFLVIKIRDNGIGIQEEDLPYIFNRFYRVDKARSREKGGNGLGLSIAKELVEKYEGNLTIQSMFGNGTTVEIAFPLLSQNEET
jgi:signal transduction histidine kinase